MCQTIFRSILVYFCFATSLVCGGVQDISSDNLLKIKSGSLLQIKLNSGIVQGKEQLMDDGERYFSFQGIPFAQPPVGKLRFRDPVPGKKWAGVLDATKPPTGCVELIFQKLAFSVTGSEDCLYLNVYTPTNPYKIKKPLPVMVWIYGGSFREGNASIYGPDYLLKDDVIVVTFNYRLGVFGFLSTGDLESPGNYGLKDQLAALKWVKENINRFGGDANSITLFGESAGSASIGYLMLAPKVKGLFHGAILQSGSPLCSWALQRNPRKIAFDLGLQAGIATNNSKTLINYLRSSNLTSNMIIDVNILNLGDSLLDGLVFGPTLEPVYKNAIVTKKSYQAYQRGDFIRVPVIIGINSQESKLFFEMIDLTRPTLVLFDLSPSLFIRPSMKIPSKVEKRIVSDKIRSYYFKSRTFIGGTDRELANFVSDDQFVRPITKTAKLISSHVPVYFYVLNYEGAAGKFWINFRGKENKNVDGVGHAEDIFYLWKTPLKLNKDDSNMASRFVRMWTNFAKFRNPTPDPDSLLQNTVWNSINHTNDVPYLDINKELKMNKNFNERNLEFWENIYQTYSTAPYETY